MNSTNMINHHIIIVKTIKYWNFKRFKNNSNFWKKIFKPIESITKSGYDKFLKFNNINEGIKSYNHSVSIIINYLNNKQS